MILTYQVNELTQPVGELFTCAQTKLIALSNKKIAKYSPASAVFIVVNKQSWNWNDFNIPEYNWSHWRSFNWSSTTFLLYMTYICNKFALVYPPD